MRNVPSKPHITIIIPAFNEEKNILKIVRDSLKIKGFKADVLVVIDSKTTDRTEDIVRKTEARVLRVKKSFGKGSNIKESIPHIRGDYVIQIDADYQFLPQEIEKLILPLMNGFDVTLGTRYRKGSNVEKGSVSPLKLFGSTFLSFLTSVLIGQRVTDVMAGFKAFKSSKLKKITIQTDHFGYEVELIIKAKQKKFKILEVPISYRKRTIGTSSVSSIKHGLLVVGTIFKTRFS